MSRRMLCLSLFCLLSMGLLTPGIRADNTTALKAKMLAKEKLNPKAKSKSQPKKKPHAQSAAEKSAKSQKGPKSLQQQADELQVRNSAFTSMMELLSDRRARCRNRVDMMIAYLKSIGKLRDYENAKTPPPTNKGEMTYRYAYNAAVAHAETDSRGCMDSPDQEEIRILRRLYMANKKLTQKTWNEYAALRDQIRSMGAYLESIGKTDDYKKWAAVEKDKQAQAQAAKMEALRKQEVSAYRKRQARKQMQREKIAAQQRQDRQENLRRCFELRQQKLYNQMRENTPAQGWCGWDDPYDDVYHNRRYYR
ncbi:MAG: hypothetical protein JXA11_01155 [Phycisphaerae bacterium]|nr:hypothetical protein [Phycisphaerae bacterium]